MSSSVRTCNQVTDFSCLCQVPAVDAQSCAAELHHALAKNDYQQASSLIRLAPHPGVFEMVNKQQQNALHLAGKQHWQLTLEYNTVWVPYPDASYAGLLTCWLLVYLRCMPVYSFAFDTCLDAAAAIVCGAACTS